MFKSARLDLNHLVDFDQIGGRRTTDPLAPRSVKDISRSLLLGRL
jgi:hypothetical protein